MKADHYALVRTAKLKDKVPPSSLSDERTGPQQIEATESHDLRLEKVLNADPSRWGLNRMVIDGRDMNFAEARDKGYLRHGLLRERVLQAATDLGIAVSNIPEDAVLAQQVLVSASAEYFNRERVGGAFHVVLDEKYARWRSQSVAFISQKYGSRLLCLVEHLDEATPHIGAYIVPLVLKSDRPRGKWGVGRDPLPATWRFAAADLFGRRQLSELWTEYAKATADLGLVRPPEKAKVSYQTMGRLYAAVAEADERGQEFDVLRKFSLPPPRTGLLPESATSYVARVAPDLNRTAEKVEQLVRNLHLAAADAKRNRDALKQMRRKLREEQERIKKLDLELTQERARRDELEALRRDVFCGDLFKALKIPSEVRGDEIHAWTKAGHKIVFMKRNFSITDPHGRVDKGTGAIEFLQLLFGLTTQQAEQLCIALVGGAAVGAITSRLIRTVGGRAPDPQVAHAFSQKLTPQPPNFAKEVSPKAPTSGPEGPSSKTVNRHIGL